MLSSIQFQRNPSAKAEAFLILCSFFWGATFAFSKIGLQHSSPLLFTALRCGLGALILLAFTWRRLGPPNNTTLKHGAILGVLLYLGLGLQTVGLEYTTASRSGFITYTAALYVPLLQIYFLKRMPALGNILGLMMVLAGLFFLTDPTGGNLNRGDLITLCCAVAYAFYVVYLSVFAQEGKIELLTTLQLAVAGTLSFCSAFLFEDVRLSFSWDFFVALLYLVLIGTIVCTYIMTRYQRETTPTRAVLIYALEPFFAILVAFIVLGELLDGEGWLGAGLILLGVIVSQLWPQTSKKDKTPHH